VHKANPMLQTAQWTREDMAVAQDWELEHGNEGALIWTDLGPDLARMVCENSEVLAVLTSFTLEYGAGAWAWAGLRAKTVLRSGIHIVTRTCARVGSRIVEKTQVRVGRDRWGPVWVETRAWAGEEVRKHTLVRIERDRV